jgi:hypothetical protein
LRFQLLDIIVELAIDKYVKKGLCSNVQEAIERIYEEDGLDEQVEDIEES